MRKGMSQGLARPAPEDRNPIAKNVIYLAANIAPHAFTTRATYTVPASKKARREEQFARIMRESAATTAGEPNLQIRRTPSGQGVYQTMNSMIGTNAIGDKDVVVVGFAGYLYAGDVMDVSTQDGSVAGTINYSGIIELTEFDV